MPTGIVSYGVDINNFPGDLIVNESKVPTRLNPSFGAITYSDNTRYGNYNGVYFDVRGHFLTRLSGCFVHPFPIAGRCRRVSHVYKSFPVLWAFPAGCPEPLLAQLQL